MVIKADYTGINGVGNDLVSIEENITLMEDAMKEAIDLISSSWIGLDSSMFLERGNEYIKQIDALKEQIKNGGNLLNEAVSDYSEIESKYAELMGGV